ncbi:C-type lectin domain family 4 member G-like [Rhinoderma darwinii]|uniref:C-type lectin domain family 4 member G-like n=1 Tax=Rhinoderma darwinii TaxID=43563 RepID=UPI003F672FCB
MINVVYTPSKDDDNDDDDDDDYENTNPCDLAPVVPSRNTRRIKNAVKVDLPLKSGNIPNETPRFQPPSIGLDFSSGAVNAAFSAITDVKMSSVPANDTFPNLEVVSSRNKQRSGRCRLVVLSGLMIIILIALVVTIGFLFLHYITISEKVTSLEKTAPGFQNNSMLEQVNLKTKVADLSNIMVKLQDILIANMKQINKTLENICTLCPGGWNMIGSSCYYVSGEILSWDMARDECYKVNSELVMIKDKTQSDSLKKLFKPNKRYWIGLRRDPQELHIWKWLDGTQVTFTNWGVNEPNYYSNLEHCGETLSGPWNDRSCVEKLDFICKRRRAC